MHTAVGIGPIDTDLQLSTDAWMPGRAGSQQPQQEHPEKQASWTLFESASAFSQTDPDFRPTHHNPTKIETEMQQHQDQKNS